MYTWCFKASNRPKISEQFSSLYKFKYKHKILVILGEAIHRTDERVLDIIEQSIFIDHMVHLFHFHYFHFAHVFHGYPLVAHFALS